jgi:acyl-coenzyme A synthetase/AMP-(fatty) acid ligase
MITIIAIAVVVVFGGTYWWLTRRSDDVVRYHDAKVSLTQVNDVHLHNRRGGL